MRVGLLIVCVFLLGVASAHLFGLPQAVGDGSHPGFADLVAQLDPSVAHVTTVLEGGGSPRSRDDAVGAGFVFAADGYLVTSRHIVEGAKKVYVGLQGRGTYEAQVVGSDVVTDVAVLRVGVQGLSPIAVGDPKALRKGDWVLAGGSPFRLPRSWSVGIVSGLGRSQVGVRLEGYEDFIQTDAAANIGNSGGPLVDASGRAVGMMTAILSRSGKSEGISLAVPVDVVMDVAGRLRAGQRVSRLSLGAVVRETDARGGGGGGLVVTRFNPDSAAQGAGLRTGDVIVSVGGTATRRVADLQRVLWSLSPGRATQVVFLRGGRRYSLQVIPR